MTGTKDIEREWMKTAQSQRVFPVEAPEIGKTYGDFGSGTARRVAVPRVTHVQETHSSVAIAETLEWMRQALHPPQTYWIDALLGTGLLLLLMATWARPPGFSGRARIKSLTAR